MRSKTLFIAGIGAALITLAGCGGNAVNGSASAQGGGTPAAPQGSSQQIKTVADLGNIVQHNTGSKNAAHITMALNVTGMGAINASGDVKFGGGQSAEHMTMTLPNMGDMEIVVIGSTSYFKTPSSMAGMPGMSEGSKPWSKFDLNSMGASSFGSTANLANQADPTQLISMITQAGTITNVTHDTVDGAATTHYSITVDVQKMIATMGGNNAAQKQAFSQWGLRSMPFDIWVNSDNLPVRITTDLAMGGMAGGGTSSQVNVTVNYTNWGESVTIQAPPADQVN